MRMLLVVCLVLIAPVQSPSQNPGETLIERRVAEHLLPGAVLLVARNGEIETLRAFGHADVEEQRAMRTNTLFRLGSAAKIVTTAGILALVDDGRVELDRPVAIYLPEFRSSRVFTDTGSRPAAQPLRVRDLLRHASGYGYGNDPRQGTAYEQSGIMRTAPVVSWSHDLSLADWSERLSTVPLTSDPGTRFEYGLGADVAGAVIERVSGQPLDEFLKNRIFAPLEMVDTGFVVSPARADRLASAYRADDNRLVRIDDGSSGRFSTRPKALSGGGGWDNLGTGGLVTSAPDFARFLQMLLEGGLFDGHRILTRESVDSIFVNQLAGTATPERQPGIGFGLGAAVVTSAVRYGIPSSDGLTFWSGSLNTRFWIHRTQRLVGVYFSQVEPFPYLDLMNDIMRASLQPPSPADRDMPGHYVAESFVLLFR